MMVIPFCRDDWTSRKHQEGQKSWLLLPEAPGYSLSPTTKAKENEKTDQKMGRLVSTACVLNDMKVRHCTYFHEGIKKLMQMISNLPKMHIDTYVWYKEKTCRVTGDSQVICAWPTTIVCVGSKKRPKRRAHKRVKGLIPASTPF